MKQKIAPLTSWKRENKWRNFLLHYTMLSLTAANCSILKKGAVETNSSTYSFNSSFGGASFCPEGKRVNGSFPIWLLKVYIVIDRRLLVLIYVGVFLACICENQAHNNSNNIGVANSNIASRYDNATRKIGNYLYIVIYSFRSLHLWIINSPSIYLWLANSIGNLSLLLEKKCF